MKRIFFLAFVISGVSHAQSNVTITGGVASAFERSTLSGSKGRITGFDPSASNVTIRGTEDLGGGLKFGFELNKRFNSADGQAFGGREFENSFISLSGGWGTVRVGRHQAISVASFDSFGGLGADFGDPKGPTGARDYAYNNMAGSRYDKAVSYTSPRFNGFDFTAVATLNPDVNTGRESLALRVGFNNGPLNLAYVEERNSSKVGGIERSDRNIGASYDFGLFKANLLWGQEGSGKSRTSIGAVIPVGQNINIKATYRGPGETLSLTTGAKTKSTSSWALGMDYMLSKRTTVFADYGDYSGSAQSAYRVGVKHSF